MTCSSLPAPLLSFIRMLIFLPYKPQILTLTMTLAFCQQFPCRPCNAKKRDGLKTRSTARSAVSSVSILQGYLYYYL